MKINYPNPSIQTKPHRDAHVQSHGMIFEHALNLANEYYYNRNLAVIYKKPTPIRIVKVDYPSRNKARITEGYYQTPSTTDYNGIYKGRYLDYEAKETNNLSFSFKHIFPHQIEHLERVHKHGGLAFIIIFFKKVNQVFIMDILAFQDLLAEAKAGGKQSISLEQFQTLGKQVTLGFTPTMDYLKAVDELYHLV
ncbi:MAG: Holliday junction resolvase RecU [Bacilli bacterium]|nr:Holliday junction resolvase RecU [Bacilli bacterium]